MTFHLLPCWLVACWVARCTIQSYYKSFWYCISLQYQRFCFKGFLHRFSFAFLFIQYELPMFGDSEFVNETFMPDVDHLLPAEKNSRVKRITIGLTSDM